MARLTTSQAFRFWLAGQTDHFGVPLAMAVSLAILAAILYVIVPVGDPQPASGRVMGLGIAETKMGSRPMATVQVEGRRVSVHLPKYHDCKVGDRIALQKFKTRFGAGWGAAALEPCSGASHDES